MRTLEKLANLGPDQRLGDRYRFIQWLGDGTYGYVFKAERLEDQEIVAVKVPKQQGKANRELEEGRGLLDAEPHQNLIRMHWMGRVPPEGEVYAIEMEYFNSHTLAYVLDSGEQRYTGSFKYLLKLYGQVLDGLVHLHKLGFIHGDIKPQNILVQNDWVKLTDFGSSLCTEDIYTRSRDNGGTVLYSPPEHCAVTTRQRKGKLGIAHDVYSLGVLLYQLLTGRLPHDTLAQVVRHTPFASPRELNSSISPKIEDVTMKCLKREPEERWTTVEELRCAFQEAQQAQLRYQPERGEIEIHGATEDWSSRVMQYLEDEQWEKAEKVARAEFAKSQDEYAFLLMVRAAYRDQRFKRAIELLETHPEMRSLESPISADLQRMALEAYLRMEQVAQAAELVDQCLEREGRRPGLLLRKASILGLQARFKEARELLIELNKQFPRRKAILRRLVLVNEQLRDYERVRAYKEALDWAKS